MDDQDKGDPAAKPRPAKRGANAGGTYAQDDFSPAAQRSRLREGFERETPPFTNPCPPEEPGDSRDR